MKSVYLCLAIPLFMLLQACQKSEQPAPAMPPPEIPVYVTKAEKVPIFQEFVGQIYGSKDIAIRARVEGFLEEIHFEEGSPVKKGDLLYVLESQPFEADVAAKMSKVAEAKTMLAKAASDLARIRPLAKNKAVSQSDLDAAVAQHDASIATMEAAEANLRASRIQLGYTRIYSPLSGIIGKTQLKVGDLVGRSPETMILNMVSNIEWVRVEFFLTEKQYLQLARRYLEQNSEGRIERKDPDDRENALPLELILADGSVYPHKGKADFIDRDVDPTLGAILIQASFPNPRNLLRPGLFAKVRTIAEEVENGILVPQRCVRELQGLFSVFVVTDNNTVAERKIVVGPAVHNFQLIREGLKAGEKIVYEGLQKVGDGVSVNPVVKDIEMIDSSGIRQPGGSDGTEASNSKKQ